MKNNKLTILVLTFMVGLLAGLMAGLSYRKDPPSADPPEREMKTETAHYSNPMPAKPDTVIRWVAVRLPAAPKPEMSDGTTVQTVDSVTVAMSDRDSAEVVLPITQRVYEDSTYRAVVEGYAPRLIELEIYRSREILTVKKPPNRFHIGPSVGLGFDGRHIVPFVGVTLTASFFSF